MTFVRPSIAVQVIMLTYSNALGVALQETPSLFSCDGEMRNFVLTSSSSQHDAEHAKKKHMFTLAGRRPAMKRIHCSPLLVKTQNLSVNILQLPPSHNTKIQWIYSSRHNGGKKKPRGIESPSGPGRPMERNAQKNRIREKEGLQGERE